MKAKNNIRRVLTIAVPGLLLLLMAGCQEYAVEVTLQPDASGTRAVSFEADLDRDWERPPTYDEYLALHHLDSRHGWAKVSSEPAILDSLPGTTFRRTAKPADASDWSLESGDIHIRGTLRSGEHSGIEFVNRVSVRELRVDDESLIEYREEFQWRGLREALAAYYAERYRAVVQGEYPNLKAAEIDQLTGLVTGLVQVAIELEDPDGPEDSDAALTEALKVQTVEIVKRRYADASVENIHALATQLMESSDDAFDQFIREVLPGVHFAHLTEIKLNVTMPGEIVETNAEGVDGLTVNWSTGPEDAVRRPLVLYVRSRLR